MGKCRRHGSQEKTLTGMLAAGRTQARGTIIGVGIRSLVKGIVGGSSPEGTLM